MSLGQLHSDHLTFGHRRTNRFAHLNVIIRQGGKICTGQRPTVLQHLKQDSLTG